ncbi:MAG: peptide chain release factor N(5)-glutamine methyltransferase [Malacoplasma sp.]|nr:peptide chain release factor N(5)-glutamine methyltransferase [Malacoplasma sp.]
MMNLLKCKKQKYNDLTFNELTKKLNPVNDAHTKWVIKELILYNSTIIKNNSDIFFESNTKIDFDYKKFTKQLSKVLVKNFPVQYITKKFSFFGVDYYINKKVFVPRMETEYMLDWVVTNKLLENKKYILDLCSGSGVLANTIAYIKKKKNVEVIGVEKYFSPYKVALKNAKKHNLKTKFIKSDIFKLNKIHFEKCDFIICNPPYISYQDFDVDESTKKEPKTALYAKDNGYYFYFEFINKIFPILKKETTIIFEIGFNQKEKLESFLIEKK